MKPLKNSLFITVVSCLILIAIYGLPVVACAIPFFFKNNMLFKILLITICPVEYAFLFAFTAALLSMPFQRGIIKGVFPRKTSHPIYAMRKLYGLCWTSLFYFKPVYSIILQVHFFRSVIFRLFGYKGSLDFVIYPDVWIRDLPLLRIEEGVYIANRSALGTNLCLLNGDVMVGNVTLKKGALAGHASSIGFGSTVGERTEIGIKVITGLHVKIGNDTVIGAETKISHYAKIGNNTTIGVNCFIGTGAKIGDNLSLPNNISIPDKTEVNTMEDVLQYA